jgi:hypothetical protein
MATKPATSEAVRAREWWVVHQHHEAKVVRSSERPSTAVQKGERLIKLHGPYRDEAAAKARAERILSRTTRARAQKDGR